MLVRLHVTLLSQLLHRTIFALMEKELLSIKSENGISAPQFGHFNTYAYGKITPIFHPLGNESHSAVIMSIAKPSMNGDKSEIITTPNGPTSAVRAKRKIKSAE